MPPAAAGQGNIFARAFRFCKEAAAELRKVQWPTRLQVAHGTAVVVFVTAVFAVFLTVVDLIAAAFIEQLKNWIL